MTDYDDIIHLPHHVSERRARMPIADRAAQFAPFAALTGYGDAIREAQRLTGERIVLDEYEQSALDAALREAVRRGADGPESEFVYFLPDERKAGGSYVTVSGCVRRLDEESGTIWLTDGVKILVSELAEIRTQPLCPPSDFR